MAKGVGSKYARKIDPHLPRKFIWNPSDEDIKEIADLRDKYRKDPALFFEERLQIIDRDGKGLIPFKLNEAQKSFLRLRDDIMAYNLEKSYVLNSKDPLVDVSSFPIYIIVLKPRKIGFSTVIQGLAYHKCEFFPQTSALIMAHESKAAKNIASISKRFNQFFVLGEEEQSPKINLNRDADDLLEWGVDPVTNKMQDSRILIQSAGLRNKGSGRGFTFNFMHFSEEAHYQSESEVSATMAAASSKAEIYEESTANGVGGLFYKNWQEARYFEDVYKAFREGKDLGAWNGKFRFFWSWLDDAAYRKALTDSEAEYIMRNLTAREEELVLKFKATPSQLAWRRDKIDRECSTQTEMEPEMYFDQEYPTEPSDAFVARGSNVFSSAKLSKIRKSAMDFTPAWKGYFRWQDRHCELVERSNINDIVVWEHEKPGSDYLVGVDIAQGLKDGDFTVITVFERCHEDLLVEVARYRGKCEPAQAGYAAIKMAEKYNFAYIVPEGNNQGAATCLILQQEMYPHVYMREQYNNIDSRVQSTYGFNVTPSSKKDLVAIGQDVLNRGGLILRDLRAIEEWMQFKNNDGILEAPEGQHDDMVMCDLLCCFIHFTGRAPVIRKRVGQNTQEEMRKREEGNAHATVMAQLRRQERLKKLSGALGFSVKKSPIY